LERKFSSIEYMEEVCLWHKSSVDALKGALQAFYGASSSLEDWHQWPKSDWPETWESRVLVNLESTQDGIEEGVEKAKKGDYRYIESVCNEVHNVFRNLSNFGWGWWDHIPSSHKQDFNDKLVKASKLASNIMRELAKAWKTEDSILNEEITGPIDENELKRYLRPGESV